MEMEIVDVIPKTKEGDIFVMSSNFLKSLLSAPAAAEKRYDTNVIEKIEQEQIDDKYILRWTAIVETSNVKEIKKPLRAKDLYKRAQSGFIYAPNMFGNKGLLVLFTDYNFMFSNPGLPPLEAMACGFPVVTSNVTSIPEVVGDAALLCNPYDPEDIAEKMDIALSMDRQILIQKGLARARQFTWDKVVQQTWDVYCLVVGQ